MESTSTLTELREAALALWKHQKEEQERTAAREAAERALDVFGDTAGILGDPQTWRGDDDGDAMAIPALDEDGRYRLEYDHTFGEQLWLRSGCPACGRESGRTTPVTSVLELGQALDRLEAGWGRREQDAEIDTDDLPGACDHCDGPGAPAEQLYQAVVAVIESAREADGDEDLDEVV